MQAALYNYNGRGQPRELIGQYMPVQQTHTADLTNFYMISFYRRLPCTSMSIFPYEIVLYTRKSTYISKTR
jgi:hypothetical protein